jgi:hypothetical protein
MHRPAGRGGPHREEMSTYRALLDNHDSIHRVVEEIPGGVRTVTTSSSPEIVPLIRRHVEQMHRLLVDGGRIRAWDPLFAEIFAQADAIEMVLEEVENGISVTETSEDSAVVELIRAHARKVEDFVARGHAAYEEETPLPAGYE